MKISRDTARRWLVNLLHDGIDYSITAEHRCSDCADHCDMSTRKKDRKKQRDMSKRAR